MKISGKTLAVTTVTSRDVSPCVARVCDRDNRDTTLWGVTYVTLTPIRYHEV